MKLYIYIYIPSFLSFYFSFKISFDRKGRRFAKILKWREKSFLFFYFPSLSYFSFFLSLFPSFHRCFATSSRDLKSVLEKSLTSKSEKQRLYYLIQRLHVRENIIFFFLFVVFTPFFFFFFFTSKSFDTYTCMC